ncbi:hypothetical protein [Sphingomonas japonica]|uniref:hypothetical protein n=1 Tax=Sphingomonas japonica TaxID=511662 RepID=UPI001FB902EE|nr:hypothetical protein [Sphingomonas japonica]
MKRLRRAAKTAGSKLHLPAYAVQVLLRSDVYDVLARLEAQAMRELCGSATANDNSLVNSGYGSARTAAPGTSAGLNDAEQDAMSRGARQRLLGEVRQISRPLRLKTL